MTRGDESEEEARRRAGAPDPHEAGELVAEDDAVIGRAFRWSLVALGALGVAAGLAWWLTRERAPEVFVRQEERVAARSVARDVAPPSVRFTDVTERSGIAFERESGARGAKLLPETMGGGAAFFDREGDGDQDLVLVNGVPWPEDAGGGPLPTQALYENDGAGSFSDVTAAAGLAVSFQGMGVAAGDADGDGAVDLFFTAVGPNRMFRSAGARFEDVTARAGVAGADDEWSTSAAFFDLENDGDLDLFVCNYVRWSREIDERLDNRLTGVGRAYGPPTQFEGTACYLYRNAGDGSFADVSEPAGVRVVNPATGEPMAKALGVAPCDVDGDGLVDLLVANDTVRNFFFHNLGDGSFEETASLFGVGFDRSGNATGAMGVDGAFYRNDDTVGFAIGNFANEMSSLYVSQGRRNRFADESITEGIGAPTRAYLSFGLFFFDYDLDGRLDLLQANGHLEEEINRVQPSQHYRQPAQLFWNAGPDARATFVEVAVSETGDLGLPQVGRGCAYADVDGDGDLDVLVAQPAGRPRLLRNEQALGHHWLRVALRGTRSNRDGIGAWVELEAGGVLQRRQVMPARSYLTSVELPVTFGLGGAQRVDALRVVWPGGAAQPVPVPGVDRTIVVVEE